MASNDASRQREEVSEPLQPPTECTCGYQPDHLDGDSAKAQEQQSSSDHATAKKDDDEELHHNDFGTDSDDDFQFNATVAHFNMKINVLVEKTEKKRPTAFKARQKTRVAKKKNLKVNWADILVTKIVIIPAREPHACICGKGDAVADGEHSDQEKGNQEKDKKNGTST